jgi:hypothetical protein
MAIDLQPATFPGAWIENKQVRAGVVNNAFAVGSGETHVIVGVVGVAFKVLADGSRRVKIADAFVVGEEKDAVADPHRPADVSVESDQTGELAARFRIDPDLARGSAAVTFPTGGIVVITTEGNASAGRD